MIKIWSKKLWVLPAYCYLPCRHVAYPLAHPAVQHRTGVEVLLLLLYDTAQGQQADNNLQCGLLHSYMLFTSCRATSGKNNDALIEKKSNHISKLWSRFYLCLCSGLLNPCGSRKRKNVEKNACQGQCCGADYFWWSESRLKGAGSGQMFWVC